MKKINIQNEANINAKGELNSGHCKPIICIDTGEVFTSITDAIKNADCHFTHMYRHLRGDIRHVKGKHYCYLSRVNESLDAIVTRLRETAAVESDAKKWQEYQAEQEAIRKAEEKRLEEERKAEERRQAEIARLMAKRANLNNKAIEYNNKYNQTMNELVEVEQALEAMGIELEGGRTEV